MKNGSAKHAPTKGEVPLTKNREELHQKSSISTQNAIIYLVIIFLVSIFSLGYIYSIFPELEEAEREHIKLPRDIEDAKNLGIVLSHYKEKYFTEVLGGVFVTYIL